MRAPGWGGEMADETSLPVWLSDTTKLIIPILAIVGASYTAIQLRRTRRWRAGDLANTLVSQLEKDDELAFACHILDWGVGPLVVPQRYRPLLEQIPDDKKNPTPAERGAVIQQDRELIGRALRVRLEFDVKKEPAGLIYRYCFDKLFAHLANVHRLVETKQLELKDLNGLKYWLERIADYEYPPKGIAGDAVFQPFLRHGPFGYQGVIELGKRLGVPGWVDPKDAA
jgi:hypothetical protein